MHVYTYFMKVAIDSHYRVERCSICEKIGREGGREGGRRREGGFKGEGRENDSVVLTKRLKVLLNSLQVIYGLTHQGRVVVEVTKL